MNLDQFKFNFRLMLQEIKKEESLFDLSEIQISLKLN